MTYSQLFEITRTAMNLEKLRVDVVAENLAKQQSIQGNGQNQFTPSRVVSQATPFEKYFNTLKTPVLGVTQIDVRQQKTIPQMSYQPSHPLSNAQGFVEYPGVNTLDEMTTLLQSSRAYEADVRLMNIAHNMAQVALSIGSNNEN